MIKAIIFDAFEVLFLNASGYFFDMYIADEAKRNAFMAVNAASDRNELSYDERIDGIAKVTGKPYEFVRDTIYKDTFRNEELFAFIKALQPNYKLALLSNTGVGSIEQFASDSELKNLFNEVVLSYQVGLTKPDNMIFELTAQRLGVHPTECVFIDDSKINCQAAERTGMQAIQYINFNDFEVRIEELLK